MFEGLMVTMDDAVPMSVLQGIGDLR